MRIYQRTIVFTKVPLGGFYRYKDIFQIFPADLSVMPNSSFKKDYPNILEYWFTEEEKITRETEFEELKDLTTLTATTTTNRDKILSLLTSFTNNRFFRYSDYDGFWGIPMLYDEITDEVIPEVNSWSAKWCSIGYHYPELPEQMKISEFATPNLNRVTTIPHLLFYTFKHNLDNDRKTTINFPSTIDRLFDAYFSFNQETREILDAAIGYNVAAIELSTIKRTLSLLASFTSVETMVNLEYRNLETEKCDVCGQLKYSTAKKLREYLLKYMDTLLKTKRNLISIIRLEVRLFIQEFDLKVNFSFQAILKSI